MGAPKGNQFAKGHGRPPIHTDPEKVAELIDDYFEWIEGEKAAEDKPYTWERAPEPPTVTGLTLHLGFADKSSLYDYAEKESFSHSIKRALARIEKHHEIQIAHGDKCTGNIFALKNFGWKDRMDLEIETKLSPSERKARIAALKAKLDE